MSVLQNINGSLYRMDASDLAQLAAVDTEGILGGTPGATTNGQTLVDQLAADDVQAQSDIGQIKTDLSDQQDEIEAIVNVYGAKNLAKTKGQTNTINGVTYTANADGTYTPSNTAASGGNSWYNIWISGYTIPAGTYYIGDASGAGFVDGHRNSIRLSDNTYITPNTVVTLTDSLQIVEWSLGVANGTTAEQRDFKPVIIDSRILDRSFTTPVMTNRELTKVSSATITYENGISQQTAADKPLYKQGNICCFAITLTGITSTQGSWVSVGTLPTGFIPPKSLFVNVTKNGSGDVLECQLQTNGNVRLRDNSAAIASTDYIHFNGTFIA